MERERKEYILKIQRETEERSRLAKENEKQLKKNKFLEPEKNIKKGTRNNNRFHLL